MHSMRSSVSVCSAFALDGFGGAAAVHGLVLALGSARCRCSRCAQQLTMGSRRLQGALPASLERGRLARSMVASGSPVTICTARTARSACETLTPAASSRGPSVARSAGRKGEGPLCCGSDTPPLPQHLPWKRLHARLGGEESQLIPPNTSLACTQQLPAPASPHTEALPNNRNINALPTPTQSPTPLFPRPPGARPAPRARPTQRPHQPRVRPNPRARPAPPRSRPRSRPPTVHPVPQVAGGRLQELEGVGERGHLVLGGVDRGPGVVHQVPEGGDDLVGLQHRPGASGQSVEVCHGQ